MITLENTDKVVGLRQSRRVLREGGALKAYLAADTEEKVAAPIREACAETGTELVIAPSMAELGEACGLDVGASVAVILK